MLVLAVDPGSDKAGIALVSEVDVIEKSVVRIDEVVEKIKKMSETFQVDQIIVGNGTGSQKLIESIQRQLKKEVLKVDEESTSRLARERYLKEHKNSFVDRILPVGMRVPKEPYDDYVAVILAERYIKTKHDNTIYSKSKS